jgi:hypothetical protein
MLFLQYIITNLVLTKSSGPKSRVVSLTEPIFAGSCVCVTQILVGGDSSYSSFPPTPGGTRPPLQFLFKQAISHGCGLIRPQICGRFSPHAVR